jgi:hypothetical protein
MSTQMLADPIAPRQEGLETLVRDRVGNRVRDLRIILRADGLVLEGRAATYHAKQLAQHVAMELSPVPILANDIRVG